VRILVDSDILIEVARMRDPAIAARWVTLTESGAAILVTPVSVAELWAGVRPSEHESLTDLLGSLRCVTIDGEVGRKAGDYLRMFQKSHSLDIADALIAASAFMNKATLWTRNRKHYPMKEMTFF
jgi:predicted nucleic acid-binding protein